MFLKKKGAERECMEREKKYKLDHGDSFTLLVHDYKIKLELEGNRPDLKRTASSAFPEDSEGEETTTKKQKVQNPVKPLCPYGLNCYRKNPEHR